MDQFKFSIQGSQGDPYEVMFQVNGAEAHAFCTCKAGQSGTHCKHRIAILAGDLTKLESDNASDVNRLHQVLHGTDLDLAYVGM